MTLTRKWCKQINYIKVQSRLSREKQNQNENRRDNDDALNDNYDDDDNEDEVLAIKMNNAMEDSTI